MASFFSRIKSAVKAAVQAFKKPKAAPTKAAPPKAAPTKAAPPKAAPPKAAPPKAAPPKAAPPKAAPPKKGDFKPSANKAERVTRLQEIVLNKNRDAGSAFYAATVGLWNVPEGKDEDARNKLIIEKLGVSNLKEAFDIVMSRYNEIMLSKSDEDLDYDPIVLTQLQAELAGRVRGQNELTS